MWACLHKSRAHDDIIVFSRRRRKSVWLAKIWNRRNLWRVLKIEHVSSTRWLHHGYHATVLVVKLLASCKWSAQSSPCEVCVLTAVIDTKRFVLRSTRAWKSGGEKRGMIVCSTKYFEVQGGGIGPVLSLTDSPLARDRLFRSCIVSHALFWPAILNTTWPDVLFLVHTKDSAFTTGEYEVTRSSSSAVKKPMSSCALDKCMPLILICSDRITHSAPSDSSSSLHSLTKHKDSTSSQSASKTGTHALRLN